MPGGDDQRPKIAYAIGYSGRSVAEVRALAERLDATILDVRLSPRSRRPEWSGRNLTEALGDRYLHAPMLGNRNYQGGPVGIVNLIEGIALIAEHPRPVILMCLCADWRTCHRTLIGKALRQRGYIVTELGMANSSAGQQRLL